MRGTNWKSSPLALLFHGLDKETQERYGQLDDLDEMDEKAKEVNVQLRRDGERGLGTSSGWEMKIQEVCRIILGHAHLRGLGGLGRCSPLAGHSTFFLGGILGCL